MPFVSQVRLLRLFKLLTGLLIVKVLMVVLLNFRDYLPPNFDADFLLGRDSYFWDGYHWAFYAHIASGPITLILGMILLSESFRRQWPRWHRVLGRIQVVLVLCVMAPSGLWMARYAASGPVAGLGFAILAVATGGTIALGWRAAVMRRFEVHRLWMQRCFVLLCSTVIVRVNGGVGALLGIDAEWFYAQTAWTSWLVPLLLFELWRLCLSPRSVTKGRARVAATSPIGPPSLTGG